jgi:hypothetical protein
MSINRALYNFNVLHKHKADRLKKEIIYYSSDKGNVNQCVKMHSISKENPNAYLLFINFSREETEKNIIDLNGKEITPENYSKFVNLEKLIKEFDIKNEEIENDSGILGAIYNRISLKDSKIN